MQTMCILSPPHTRAYDSSTTPLDSTTRLSTVRTSWRSDVSSPWMRRHTGGSRQDTHGTPVPSLLGRPWVAHHDRDRHHKCHKRKVLFHQVVLRLCCVLCVVCCVLCAVCCVLCAVCCVVWLR